MNGNDLASLRALFRRLHGAPMQATASASVLLAVWERSVRSGDTQAALDAARMLADQLRSIAPALQAIEREGYAILDALESPETTTRQGESPPQ
jgi:hypothetical protein